MNTLRRRNFTDDEKRKIVDEVPIKGINVMLQEYSLQCFLKVEKKVSGWRAGQIKNRPKDDQQPNALVVENERLKKINANLALEL